jgi:CDP-diacylglycerol--glycerol-3-phosphate 3-phosphatidyltransferase
MSLPNKITLARIALIPLMVFAFYLDDIIGGFIYGGLIAALLFFTAAVTDFLDGHIARKYNLVTTMGKFLDPIADKILVVAALFLTVEGGLIAAPYGAVFSSLIVARELIISGFRQIAASNGTVISADKLGKIKTVFQDIAMIMFLLLKWFKQSSAIRALALFDIYVGFCYAILALALILTLWSGIAYIVKNKAVFG